MAAPLFLLLIAGGARLSYIEAMPMRSPHLRGMDSYNRLPSSNNTSQNREVIVDEAWSRSAEWSQQRSSSLNTTTSSCGEGDSFTVSSQKPRDLAGCYIKTGQHNDEEMYTFVNRMGRKYTVAAINFNETNARPDMHWTLARMDSFHHDIVCISVEFAYRTHPVDASWTCDFSSSAMFSSPRDMVPIAASSNDIVFSCGCPTVKRDSLYKTVYHRRSTTSNDADVFYVIAIACYFVAIIGRFLSLVCRVVAPEPPRIVLVRVPTRRARGGQNSSSAETGRNTQASAATSSNEPGSEMEMMHLLRRPGGAANNRSDTPEEGEGIPAVLQ